MHPRPSRGRSSLCCRPSPRNGPGPDGKCGCRQLAPRPGARVTRETKRPHVPPLQVVTLGSFLDMELRQPDPILGNLLREGSLGMVHGRAGAGKTFLMLALAISAAYGVPFLGWDVPAPVPVFYVDGEMTAPDLQSRAAALTRWVVETINHPWEELHVVTPDFQPHGIPKIDSQAGRQVLLDAVKTTGARLVFLDNLSCLTNPEDDNQSSSWSTVQELLLALRRSGIATIVGHHSGKNGEQRGTSRRADILDLVIKLTPNSPIEADGRTRVQVEFEKARHLRAEEKETFTAILEPHPLGGLVWSRSGSAPNVSDRIREMLLAGMSPAEVSTELATARSFVYRVRNQLIEAGDITRGAKSSGCPLSPSLEGGRGDTHRRPLKGQGDTKGTNQGTAI